MKIEEAKKYIGKVVYWVDEDGVKKLYIGGLKLFFNQVDFEVDKYTLYEDKKYSKCFGDINCYELLSEFKEDRECYVYTMSESLALQYKPFIQRSEKQKKKARAIRYAKDILKDAGVDCEFVFKD